MSTMLYALRGRAALLATLALLALPVAAAGTLDKVKESGKLTLGYRTDTRPFAFDDGGKPAGFSVALCQRIVDAVKAELKLTALQVEFVQVSAATRFEALQKGQIDLLCGTATPTLERRALVDFSIPIYASGTGALVRADVDRRLRDALAGREEELKPVWRGAPGVLGAKVVFAAVGGTTIEASLISALKARRIEATVSPVADYAAGVQMVMERRAAALFGDRPVLLDAASRGPDAGALLVIERSFTREPLALAMRRGDDDFRLLVDRTLSRLFRSKEIGPLFTSHFGAMDGGTLDFFRSVALPD